MRKLLVIMLVVSLSVVMLTGCTNSAENVEDIGSEQIVTEEESQVISEEESEVVSGEVSETESENSSEEVLEEVIVDYSAESVMAKIDEIIATCPYDDPEQIKAAVIGVNLEYISDEDLTTLMDTYGYTLEELKDLFDAYMEQYLHHMWLTNRWNIGAGEIMDTMNEEQDLLKYRANIADMFIGQEEAKITVDFIITKLCKNDVDEIASYVMPEEYPCTEECPYSYQSNELTSNEKAIINYICLYNEIMSLEDDADIAPRLEHTLPYDIKLNAQ